MKSKRKVKLPKYEFGAYVESPSKDLYENQIALVKAQQAAGRNSWANGLNMFGNLAMQVGGKMMSQGSAAGEGVSASGFDWGKLLQQGIGGMGAFGNAQGNFAYGGKVGVPTPIEAEGEEVIETPNGQVSELSGPSHSQGGIDMIVPSGTEIFSKKIKGSDGKTMAERKKERERRESRVQKLLEETPTDLTLKKTLGRTKVNNEKQEKIDMAKMQFAQMLMNGMKQHFASGGVAGFMPGESGGMPEWYQNNLPFFFESMTNQGPLNSTGSSSTESGSGFDFSNIFGEGNSGLTFGDAIGLGGQLYSTFAPMQNTRANRAGDTPNINAYENYGKDALNKMDQSKQYVNQVRDNQLTDLELSRTAGVKRNRNSARGVNTLRALDTAVDANANNTKTGIYNQFAQMMQQIYGQEAALENDQDAHVMAGEQAKDLADRQDRDNYYSQMAQDIATKGTGLQYIGKSVNDIKERNVTGNVMDSLFPDFNMDIYSGKMKKVVTNVASTNADFLMTIPDKTVRDTVIDKVSKKEWEIKGNKVYDVSTGREIPLTKQ